MTRLVELAKELRQRFRETGRCEPTCGCLRCGTGPPRFRRIAGFQGHPRAGLWRAGLASLGDPNALEDDEDAGAVRLDGAFRLLLLGHGPTVPFRRDTGDAKCHKRSQIDLAPV